MGQTELSSTETDNIYIKTQQKPSRAKEIYKTIAPNVLLGYRTASMLRLQKNNSSNLN